MQKTLKTADSSIVASVVEQLIERYHYSNKVAQALTVKYAQTINHWYTALVTEQPQHQRLDDVVADICLFEQYGL